VSEQSRNLARVRARLRVAVFEFLKVAFLRPHGEFTAAELGAYVAERVTAAPDSASRILRLLRKEAVVEYDVVSRAESRYRVRTLRSEDYAAEERQAMQGNASAVQRPRVAKPAPEPQAPPSTAAPPTQHDGGGTGARRRSKKAIGQLKFAWGA
jgi:hypothetical protein